MKRFVALIALCLFTVSATAQSDGILISGPIITDQVLVMEVEQTNMPEMDFCTLLTWHYCDHMPPMQAPNQVIFEPESIALWSY